MQGRLSSPKLRLFQPYTVLYSHERTGCRVDHDEARNTVSQIASGLFGTVMYELFEQLFLVKVCPIVTFALTETSRDW